MTRATRLATQLSRVLASLLIGAGVLEALVFGQLVSGLWLAFIGWYLATAATSSAQQAVLDQVLRGVDVRAVMDRAPAGIVPTTPVQSLVFDHLLDGSQRAVAVQDPAGALLGLVTLSDLRHLRQEDWTTTPVRRIMTPAAALRTVTSDEDLRQAIGLLAENRYHQLPVVEHGRLVGLLTRDHVMQYLQLRQLQRRHDGAGRAADEQARVDALKQRVG
jgi:CBS domain-containing protein